MADKEELKTELKNASTLAFVGPEAKYATREACLKAARDAQKKIRKTKFDSMRDDIAEWEGTPLIDYKQKYTIDPYSNWLIAKTADTNEKGEIIITSQYINKDGYTCNVYQKQSTDEITKITLNRPDGNESTAVEITAGKLKYDMIEESSIQPVLTSINTLVETGASMQELYKQYEIMNPIAYNKEETQLQAEQDKIDRKIREMEAQNAPTPKKSNSNVNFLRTLQKFSRG